MQQSCATHFPARVNCGEGGVGAIEKKRAEQDKMTLFQDNIVLSAT